MSRRDLVPDPTDPDDLPAPQASSAAPHAPLALRASHEDRDEVVEQLRVAAGDGRLTAEELDERLETALNARTYGELALLVSDLPAAAPTAAPVSAGFAAGPAPEVVRLQAHRSNLVRQGPWAVPRRMEVDAKGANAVIDFTQAVVTHPVLDLVLSLQSGNLRLTVPPGVVVTVDDLAAHSSNVKQRVQYTAGAPVTLLVRISGEVRSSNVVVRAPHRGFWYGRRERRAARAAARKALIALGG